MMRLRLVLHEVGHVGGHVEELIGKLVILRHYLVHADVNVLGLLQGWMVRVLATVWSGAGRHWASHAHSMPVSLRELLSILVEGLIGRIEATTDALVTTMSTIAPSSTSWVVASFHWV